MAKLTKQQAADKLGQAGSIVEDVMHGLYGTNYPEVNQDELADELSELNDKLDDLQGRLGQAAAAGK